MSIESVKQKCRGNTSHMNDETFDLTFEKDITLEMKRFEKVVKANWNLQQNMPIWNMVAKLGETGTQVKNRFFEKHKTELVQKYLELICDLYDYKPNG